MPSLRKLQTELKITRASDGESSLSLLWANSHVGELTVPSVIIDGTRANDGDVTRDDHDGDRFLKFISTFFFSAAE